MTQEYHYIQNANNREILNECIRKMFTLSIKLPENIIKKKAEMTKK